MMVSINRKVENSIDSILSTLSSNTRDRIIRASTNIILLPLDPGIV